LRIFKVRVVHYTSNRSLERLKKLQRSWCTQSDVQDSVTHILQEIRQNGEVALLASTKKFDGVRLQSRQLVVSREEMKAGWEALTSKERQAIRHASRSIRDFHKESLPKSWSRKNKDGILVGEKFDPIERVGLYVPGGQVPLVSTVLMTAIPAQVAGVSQIVLCTPPQKDSSISNGLLAAFHYLGLSEVFRAGGAQAIAAMAYGTKSIQSVDFIAGPGNAYVMEAKRQIYGLVGVDLLPGPSEVMVIADEGANPGNIAADLLSQAEHGTGKEKLYLTVPTLELLAEVESAIAKQLPVRSHGEAIRTILKDRAVAIICPDLEQAAKCANLLAPEHLELQVENQKINQLTRQIHTAGAILEGYHTPTVLGDFIGGPSHTLPTDGTGRFSGGLQVSHFLRRTSRVRSNPAANKKVEPTVRAFAEMERLDGHHYSLHRRHSSSKTNG